MASRKTVKEGTKRAARAAIEKAEKAGSRALQVLGETPEMLHLMRTDRALRSEMNEHMEAIGKRAYTLYKQARGESPFARFGAISRELEAIELIEEEYRENRVQLSQLRERLRGKGKKGGKRS